MILINTQNLNNPIMPAFIPVTVRVQEDGVDKGDVNTLNFTGDTTVSVTGQVADINTTSSGGSLFPTTGTGTATGAVVGDLATNNLTISNGGAIDETATSFTRTADTHTINTTNEVDINVGVNGTQINLAPLGGQLFVSDGIAQCTISATADIGDNSVNFNLDSNDNSANPVNILGNGKTSTITHTADTHTINGALDVNGATDIVGNSTITGTLTMTGAVKTSANNTDDIGDSTNSFKDAYVRRVLLDGSTSGVAEIKSDALANTMNGVTLTGTGIVPSTSFYIIQGSDFTLQDNNQDQNAFPAAGDVWTLQGSTTYYFEGQYYITSGASSHSIAIGFTLAGGASINTILYSALAWPVAINTATATQTTTMITQVASTAVNSAGANATQYVRFYGHIRMNGGGTVTPIMKFSAAPGGTNLMKQDSYIRFTPVGSNTVSGVGPVA